MKEQNKLMNKKGFLTRDLVITGLLFTGIIAILVLSITGIADNYGNTDIINDEFSDNYDKLTDIADNVEISRSSTSSSSGLSFIGTFDVIFSATFTVISMVFATLDLYGTIASNFVSDFTFLDASIIKLLFVIGLGILTTFVVFIWISSITKGKL